MLPLTWCTDMSNHDASRIIHTQHTASSSSRSQGHGKHGGIRTGANLEGSHVSQNNAGDSIDGCDSQG